MIKYILYLVVILTGTSCMNDEYDAPTAASDKLFRKHAQEQLIKRNMKLASVGGGNTGPDEDKLTLLSIGFKIREPLDVDSARRLIVPSINEFLDLIDKSEYVHEHLIDPFTVQNLGYSIQSVDHEGGLVRFDDSEMNEPEITIVSLVEGGLYYGKFPIEKKQSTTVHEERFEEALAIIEQENQ